MKTKLLVLGLLSGLATATLGAATVRIIQTNAAGDSVMLIDPATNKVVGEIKDVEVNHGAAVRPTAATSTSPTKRTRRSMSPTRKR